MLNLPDFLKVIALLKYFLSNFTDLIGWSSDTYTVVLPEESFLPALSQML